VVLHDMLSNRLSPCLRVVPLGVALLAFWTPFHPPLRSECESGEF
jgi:hypothetical protein